jgi:pyruvate,water dikinase
MAVYDKASTGLEGFDRVIDSLRLGDNVVWQVDSASDYKKMVDPFAAQAKLDNRKLVYIRFGNHEPVIDEGPDVIIYKVDANKGFETFATKVHNIIKESGRKTFYVFDCLTDLLKSWHSDLMIGNFFKVTCPYLYELETIAYFAIMRDVHTFATIAGIRETTQLLLDLYNVHGKLYIHPLKVWQRYSSTMFFPHLIQGHDAICITSSSEVAELFSSIKRGEERLDYWNVTFNRAKEALDLPPEQQEQVKKHLMHMLFGGESRMFQLCIKYFSLKDILNISTRVVGTGQIGGKSIGMLLARKILEKEGKGRFTPYLEPHDSFYIGADVFYTYIVQNGWWKLRTEQKSREGYFRYAPELKEKLLGGRFPKEIQEQLVQMLEYFGQSPIIVRSSSLLEDNFGNAFAGKYESVFCANQGTPEERYEAFEQAIKTVYASTMNEDALTYRMNRGLFGLDEQMAILVQRVSGDQYGDFFFPHIAGVGNSSNLYVWDKSIDMDAGMLRLVFGLGTRAVDRAAGDYARIVCLDNPMRVPPISLEDRKKYSQHGADVISLKDNVLADIDLEKIFSQDIKTDKELFASLDIQTANRLRELGYTRVRPFIYDFDKLLKHTDFPVVMREILALLSKIYDYPVDIEFTANFTRDGRFRINLLQCRPLQTRGLGKPVRLPRVDEKDCLFSVKGNFMGGNVRLSIDYVVYVDAKAYSNLNEQDKYAAARQIGQINSKLKGKNAILVGPGRWGTTTPSLGVPVNFSEICNMSVICEVSSTDAGFMPELSYGSHFFQDLVEAGIFYVAIIEGQRDTAFNPERLLQCENLLESIITDRKAFSNVIHVAETTGMEFFSDIGMQMALCR